ncbi:MAG: YigZ family protein [Flavobacteriaceae bacterium]|nr:YigZ family protein [Flavobacteriaceae bacterium]
MLEKDTYKTVVKPSDGVIFKDRGSKFLGYAYPLHREDQVKAFVDNLKKEHHKARHWCYAWQLGSDAIKFRVNDDGEPNNSAGQPIYGQILSKELTNVLVVVVRYFGGTKLGVGGLVNAYKTSAQLALEAAQIITRTIDIHFKLIFEYQYMNKVMRIIKEKNATIVAQKMELNCEYEVSIRKKEASAIKIAFEELRHVKVVEF